jgi:hypothetical protein
MATERVALCRTQKVGLCTRYAAIEMMKQGGGLTISAVLGYLYYHCKKNLFWV